MADNRKYYYLKLKENFFDSDSIVPVSYTHLVQPPAGPQECPKQKCAGSRRLRQR